MYTVCILQGGVCVCVCTRVQVGSGATDSKRVCVTIGTSAAMRCVIHAKEGGHGPV